jgi:hypothetical protein
LSARFLCEPLNESMRKCGATMSPVVLALIALPLIGLDRRLPEGPLSRAAPQNLMLPNRGAQLSV